MIGTKRQSAIKSGQLDLFNVVLVRWSMKCLHLAGAEYLQEERQCVDPCVGGITLEISAVRFG